MTQLPSGGTTPRAPRDLRSNYEPGTSRWATRRAQWLALGLSDADMLKPKIAIVNTSSQLAICFSHLDSIAARVKRSVEAAGGIGFEVRTAAPSDFIHSAGHRGGYILSARDLITNDIEMQVEGAQLDGMICLASCDKTAPGQLMAAARLNIPTIIVACGYQASGSYRGRHCDIEDVFLAAGHVASGGLSVDELTEMSANAVLSPGVCAGIGTANTMHLACEALGMALPGSTPVRANSEPMWRAVDAAGARIVEMVAEDLKPRDILTPAAFGNAVTAILSVSGSINSVKHLQAVAAESECDADVYRLFETLADGVPLLTAIRPNGETPIEDFEDAGGTRALMKQLEPLLDGRALTVTGRTVAANLDEVGGGGSGGDQDTGKRTGTAADDRADPRQPLPRCRDRKARRRRRPSARIHRARDRLRVRAGGTGRGQGGPDRVRPGRGTARPWGHRLPRHGHGLRACLRA